MELLIAFLQRVLSGVQSYFGYSKSTIRLVITSILMSVYPIFVYHDHWFWYTFAGVNAIIVFMKNISFELDVFRALNRFKDIHLWESLVTGGFVLYMCLSGYNILLICCSVYPALIIHKGLINLGSKLTFFAEATDDLTGKTYGIPILGIKIPRSGTKFRIIAAVVSLAIVAIQISTGLGVRIHL